jgi:putative membrane protein
MGNAKWGAAAIVATLALAGPANAQESGSQMGQRQPTDQTTKSTESADSQRQTTGESNKPGSDSAAEAGTRPGSTADQGTGSSSTSSSGSSQGSSARSGQGEVNEDLTEAVQKLHASNQAEIHMGQMGVQSAQSPEVKQYAQTIADDHQKNDQQLQQLAQQNGIELEGKAFQKKQEDSQDHMKKLEGKTGAEFDKQYVEIMAKDHKKDVKEVEKAAKEARKQNKTELASFLEQTKTGLQGHLQEAQRLEKSVDQAERQGRRGPSTGRSGDTSGSTGSGTSGSGASGSGSSSGSSTSPGTGGTGSSSGTGGEK